MRVYNLTVTKIVAREHSDNAGAKACQPMSVGSSASLGASGLMSELGIVKLSDGNKGHASTLQVRLWLEKTPAMIE